MGAGRLLRDFPEKSGKSGFFGNIGLFFFPYVFLKIWPKTPRESKTRCGDSFCIDKSSIRANLTDFVFLFRFFFEITKQNGPKMKVVFNFFPTPQPPSTLGPSLGARARSCDSGGGINSSVRPNGASFMPIFRFKFRP